MKAHELITNSTTFNPDQIKAMREAFDRAWKSYCSRCGDEARVERGPLVSSWLRSFSTWLEMVWMEISLKEAALERIFTTPRRNGRKVRATN